jgi:predicted Holliday junction resolvase-like endonuclease
MTGNFFSKTEFVLLALCLGLLAGVFFLALAIFRLRGRLSQLQTEFQDRVQKSLGQSRSVLLGQVAEHFAPILEGFPFNPKDARFLGQPVDYLVFDGLSDEAQDVQIVFCEIKTGSAGLSAREKALKAAVEAQRVSYRLFRIDPQGKLHDETPFRKS